MSLTSHLRDKTYVYDAIIAEVPLLKGNDAKNLFNFANVSSIPDKTNLNFTRSEATLMGTAFDEYQRALISGTWAPVHLWDPTAFSQFPILSKIFEYLPQVSEGEIALTLAFFDNMRRAGVETVIFSDTWGHCFAKATPEQFFASLPKHLAPALNTLSQVNTSIIDHFRTLAPKILAPTFYCSGLIGGADADAIYGNSLIELKTSFQLRPADIKKALLQSAGYILLDSDDSYNIDSIVVWFSRQTYILELPVASLIGNLDEAKLRVKEKIIYGYENYLAAESHN